MINLNTTFMHCDAKSTKITFGEVLFLFEGIATTCCSSQLFAPELVPINYKLYAPTSLARVSSVLWLLSRKKSDFLPAGPRQPHNVSPLRAEITTTQAVIEANTGCTVALGVPTTDRRRRVQGSCRRRRPPPPPRRRRRRAKRRKQPC